MPKNHQKIILTIFFTASLILLCSSFSVAEGGLEIGYPTVPGAETPGEETKLPEYIKYIFNFSVIIAGILAFAMIVFGGIVYLISAGDPTKIGDAKSRMFGGIAGLVLLLMTYLILTTINPELAILKEMESLEPVTGVYLIDSEGEKRYYASSAPSIKDFEAVEIEFISDTDELSSVLFFYGENYQGEGYEFENMGRGSNIGFSAFPFPYSVYFLWNRPGVYLYEETNFGLDERPPLHLTGSAANLGDWDNKAKSLKFKHPEEKWYNTIPFSKPEFKGKCSLIYGGDDISNLNFRSSVIIDSNYPPIGNSNISSMVVYLNDLDADITGNVTFYRRINCDPGEDGLGKLVVEGGPTMVDVTGDMRYFTFEDGTLTDKNVLSFEINGPFGVVLNTELDRGGRCQFFQKPSGTNCKSTVKGEYIYSADPEGHKVRYIMIIPMAQ